MEERDAGCGKNLAQNYDANGSPPATQFWEHYDCFFSV